MNKTLMKAAMSALGILAVGMAFAQASLDKTVSLTLKDADMLKATTMLSKLTGLKFVMEPSEREYALINLSLEDVSAGDAIRYICQAAGAYAERDENGVFVIRSSASKPVVKPETTNLVAPKRLVTKKAYLMKADARNVLHMIRSGNAFDPDEEYFNIINTRDQLTGMKPMAHRNMINSGVANTTAAPDMNDLLPETNVNPFAGQGRAGGAGQLGGAGGIGGGGLGGQGGGIGGQGLGGGLGGQQGGGDFSQLQPGDGSLVPEGTESLGYDPSDGSILFRGTDEAYQNLLDLLDLFDVAPEQVVIKVEFITTSNSLDKSLGIDWLYERGGIFAGGRPGTFARASDPIFLNYATGNVTTRLRTLLSDGYGRVVNAPMVRTMNNQLATVNFTQTTTIFVNSIVTNAQGQFTQSQPQSLTVNTGLSVRPRINGDRTITMTLAPTIGEFGQLRRGPDGQEIPDQLTQSLFVSATVKNGQTVALGGLTRKRDDFSQTRFPILGDLPIIGQLFRSRNSQQTTSELLIFVTPVIVDAGQSGLEP